MITVQGNGKTVYGPNIVTDGLILYLDAANTKSFSGGTIWYDLSGNESSGILSGATFNDTNQGNILFDGINDYVQILNNSILNPSILTLSCWSKRMGNGSGNYEKGLISKGISSGYILGWHNNNYLYFDKGFNTGWKSVTFANNINNVWFNIAGTFDGSSMLLYVDGILRNSLTGITSTPTSDTASPPYVGRYYESYFNGFLNSAKIYDRALSASEILQNYNALKSRYK